MSRHLRAGLESPAYPKDRLKMRIYRMKSYKLFYHSPKTGSILVLTLWALCLLATLAVTLAQEVRYKTMFVRRLDERDKLRLIAEAGVKKSILQLEKAEPKPYDALNDDWSSNAGLFRDNKIGDGKFNICYNISRITGAQALWWGIADEERKININKSSLTVLKRFFRIMLDIDEVESQELAAAIVDWRDSDSQLSIPIGSAEDSYYRGLSYPYEAKDAEFDVLEEALLVKGINTDNFIKLKDYITIYGSGKVNINTAAKPVLLALGIDEDIVDKIITFRCGQDGIAGNGDDNIFTSTPEIAQKLSAAFNLRDSEVTQLSAAADNDLTVQSNNFMIRSVANLDNKKNTMETICVVNRNGRILYWQES